MAAGAAPAEIPEIITPEARQLRKVHLFEKAFLERACALSEEQKQELAKLDDHWQGVALALKPGIAGIGAVLAQGILRQGGLNNRGAVDRTAIINNAVTKYRSSLRKQFSELLTPEQRNVYEEELAARDEFSRRTDAECLVALLDDRLHVRPDQREPLTKALMDWEGKNALYLAYMFRGQEFFPQIPDDLLAKHLTREQLSIYRQAPKMMVMKNQIMNQEEGFGE